MPYSFGKNSQAFVARSVSVSVSMGAKSGEVGFKMSLNSAEFGLDLLSLSLSLSLSRCRVVCEYGIFDGGDVATHCFRDDFA